MAWRLRGSPANTGVATRGTGHVSGYRQTLARVHPVIRVPGLAHLLLLGPAPALAQLGVPQLQGEHCVVDNTGDISITHLTLLYWTRHWPLAPMSVHLHSHVLLSNIWGIQAMMKA